MKKEVNFLKSKRREKIGERVCVSFHVMFMIANASMKKKKYIYIYIVEVEQIGNYIKNVIKK